MELSPALPGGWERPNDRGFCTSRFNPAWCGELGIEPKVIFDVGAYDGGDALRLAREFPLAIVHAIEGDPALGEKMIDLFGDVQPRIFITLAAALDRNGETDWYQGGLSSRCGSIYRWPKKSVPSAPRRVACARLDSVCEIFGITEIDLLHMDVEGAEIFVLNGLGELRPKLIFAETVESNWIGAPPRKALFEKFEEMGYRLRLTTSADSLFQLQGAAT